MAKDDYNRESDWSEIKMFPVNENSPPSTPIITGPDFGGTGQDLIYKVVSTDPHNQDVYYAISWGNAGSGWHGPYPSGQEVEFEHTWKKGGKFTIRVKAKDCDGAESDYATLDVTIRKSRAANNNLFIQFLQQFINSFPILRQLLL